MVTDNTTNYEWTGLYGEPERSLFYRKALGLRHSENLDYTIKNGEVPIVTPRRKPNRFEHEMLG